MPLRRTGKDQPEILAAVAVPRAFPAAHAVRIPGVMLCLWLALLASSPAFSTQTAPRRGGRYDQQILVEIQKIIAAGTDYKNVRAEVEDGIVTLTGKVRLESSRVWIENKARNLPHVEGLRSRLTLDPPPVPDRELALRVRTRLSDGGFENVRVTVRNGAVVLTGVVRNPKEQRQVLQIVRVTPGVKEAESKLTIAY